MHLRSYFLHICNTNTIFNMCLCQLYVYICQCVIDKRVYHCWTLILVHIQVYGTKSSWNFAKIRNTIFKAWYDCRGSGISTNLLAHIKAVLVIIPRCVRCYLTRSKRGRDHRHRHGHHHQECMLPESHVVSHCLISWSY